MRRRLSGWSSGFRGADGASRWPGAGLASSLGGGSDCGVAVVVVGERVRRLRAPFLFVDRSDFCITAAMPETKTEQFNVRWCEADLDLIRLAAAKNEQTLADFIRGAALRTAGNVLARAGKTARGQAT